MYQKRARGWLKHADFLVVDIITMHLVMLLNFSFLFEANLYSSPHYLNLSILMTINSAIIFLLFDTMHNVLKRGYYDEFKQTLRHTSYLFGLTGLIIYLQGTVGVTSRAFIFITFFIYLMASYSTRYFWKLIVQNFHTPISQKRLMFALLNPDTAEDTMLRINHSPVKNYDIIGIILNAESGPDMIDGVPVVAFTHNAARYIAQSSADAIYVDCDIMDPGVVDLIDACVQMALPIHYHVPSIFSEENKTFIEKIGGDATLTTTLNYLTVREQIAKRVLDIIGGLVGSVIALILMLIIGPMIKIASPGPILFAQERIGLNGRHFKMYKFRSMVMDADKIKKELMEQNKVEGGLMFKMENDPRIIGNKILPDGTCKKGIGDFIRRTSLDEFPQFFNVLLGQMSLVGTRPPTVDEWERYEYHHRARLACKPGITGLWQISGRSEITDFEEVVRLDTEYIVNWSFALDLKILMKTVQVVLLGKGAL